MKAAELSLLGVRPDRADVFAGPITAAMEEYDISTRERQAAFIAQVLHESGMMKYTTEIWGPTVAQSRYEGRADLGNNQPGDGKRFMGRGLLQTTGRANYERTGQALGMDLIEHPEFLATPMLAARSAGWFWKTHGCNELADGGAFLLITKRINGGTNGLEDRERLWDMARRIFA